MVPAVIRSAFMGFTIPKEGRVNIMYPDTKNLVSTGVGNLIDPVSLAIPLPWLRSDESRASTAEIHMEFQRMKNQSCGDYRDPMKCLWAGTGKVCLSHRGWTEARKISRLHLTEAAIDELVFGKLEQMWNYMCEHWLPCLPRMPADAQLAMCSMSWALGPAFNKTWPRFAMAALAQDYRVCADECRMQGKGTIVDRNRANKRLFLNAAIVCESRMDSTKLYYPELLTPDYVDLTTRAGVQARLAQLGFDPGPIDGVYGPRTKEAIQAFQRSKGLTQDGIVGPQTRAALAPTH